MQVRKSMCKIKHVLTERAIDEADPRKSSEMKQMQRSQTTKSSPMRLLATEHQKSLARQRKSQKGGELESPSFNRLPSAKERPVEVSFSHKREQFQQVSSHANSSPQLASCETKTTPIKRFQPTPDITHAANKPEHSLAQQRVLPQQVIAAAELKGEVAKGDSDWSYETIARDIEGKEEHEVPYDIPRKLIARDALPEAAVYFCPL